MDMAIILWADTEPIPLCFRHLTCGAGASHSAIDEPVRGAQLAILNFRTEFLSEKLGPFQYAWEAHVIAADDANEHRDRP